MEKSDLFGFSQFSVKSTSILNENAAIATATTNRNKNTRRHVNVDILLVLLDFSGFGSV